MYIEKLTEYEIEYIAKQLLLIVEHGDKDHVNDLISGSEIEIHNSKIKIILPISTEEDVFLYDYIAGVSYGNNESKDKIIKTYRKFMYEKFGEQYKKTLLEYYRKLIEEKYQNALNELNNEIGDMIE